MPHSEGPTTIAMAIAATAAALPFVAIAILNTVMVVRRTPPLNQVVENYMRRYPLIAAGLACFVGALAGHIFWSTGDNPSKPPAIWYLLPLACLLAGVVGVFGAGALGLLGTAFQPLLCSRPSSAAPSGWLAVGESIQVRVRAHCPWNDTEMTVAPGEEYSLTATGSWSDMGIRSGPDGYPTPGWGWLHKLTAGVRPLPDKPWFMLGARVFPESAAEHSVGARGEVTIQSEGRLGLFANDVPLLYWNNWGSLEVTIQRTR